ncbi:uncharacterized protein LOC144457828 [Phascolarctos cinereus]
MKLLPHGGGGVFRSPTLCFSYRGPSSRRSHYQGWGSSLCSECLRRGAKHSGRGRQQLRRRKVSRGMPGTVVLAVEPAVAEAVAGKAGVPGGGGSGSARAGAMCYSRTLEVESEDYRHGFKCLTCTLMQKLLMNGLTL